MHTDSNLYTAHTYIALQKEIDDFVSSFVVEI